MQQVYIKKSLCNNVTFEIKCKELDEYQWLQSLTTKPKLRPYIEYKQTFGTEEYMKYCLSRKKYILNEISLERCKSVY